MAIQENLAALCSRRREGVLPKWRRIERAAPLVDGARVPGPLSRRRVLRIRS